MNNFILLLLFLFFCGCKTDKKNNKTLLFIGSFTDKKPGEGIHIYEFNEETGESNLKFTLDNITNTSFLKLSPNGKYLYSVVESQMKYNGKVAAFKVDALNAKINLLNIQDCGGINPAHIAIDNSGKYLINSNYSDGSLSLFKIKKNGSIESKSQVLKFKDSSIIQNRQSSSHIHSSNFSPDHKFVFVQDLGADKIRKFNLIKKKNKDTLQNQKEINVKLGSGPRHFTFHPNGKFGFGINELSGKIDLYSYKNGNLDFIEEYLSYKEKQEIYRAADIHISPDGNFLYTSNRGPKEDSIAVFSINQNNGKLSLVQHVSSGGKHPRNFAISPFGKFLFVANQFTNDVIIFKINYKTGKLTKTQQKIKVNSPSSIQIFTYCLNEKL